MGIRLIASDLDGTLLGPDGWLSERTINALRSAIDAGIEVIPATGRGFRTALERVRPVGNIHTVVCSNGALVYDLAMDRIAVTRPIDGNEARRMVDVLRHHFPDAFFGWETVNAVTFDPGFHRDHVRRLQREPEPLEQIDAAIKLFMTHPDLSEPELHAAISPHLPAGTNASTSGAPFLELTSIGVDKATTLQSITSERGIEASEVMAFGDQMNDVAMLEWAGVGVAMGNAGPEAKSIADRVTAPNADDGVAVVIERLLAGTLDEI